jgi:cob(I)alamin adenosyltransferase
VDELNAVLGLVLSAGVDSLVAASVVRAQSELFSLGADLATPLSAEAKRIIRVSPDFTKRLEQEIDLWQEELPPLNNFILPGGTLAAGFLHQARTVCRRAERWLSQLQRDEEINPETLRYINRLSDWLFVAARITNHRAGSIDTEWSAPL